MMKNSKQAYIETFGCQMNDRDSEIMAQLLSESSYEIIADMKMADVVIVNTCSIRGKAEQKAMSLLGRLRLLKKKKPSLVVAVAGCVAQQEGPKLIERLPYVDLVVGTQNIYNLPRLLSDFVEQKKSHAAIEQSAAFVIPPFLPAMSADSSHKKFVTIMQGCNNFCTYCVVPFTRGREISRKVEDIIAETTHLVKNGVKEITLLGQNVNSYGLDKSGELPANGTSFPDLLRQVSAIKGVKRLRFTTSNPKDLSEDLMKCFAELDNLCPHFHLPVQSGANAVLKSMNRKYTIEQYLDRVKMLRSYSPDIAITTDLIVGFPGETDADFAATMQLLEEVRYHGAYSFKYSDRPNARSTAFADKVEDKVKSRRLQRLQFRQEEITMERNREYEGRIIELMMESSQKNAAGQWCGRTGSNHIVNFTGGTKFIAGQIIKVVIDEACKHSLRGSLVESDQ